MKYKCHFPLCEYATSYRSKIDHHHLVPREVDSNSKSTVPLCKNHHALIFFPKSKLGQHSINTPESIQILNIYPSTVGDTVHYQDYKGKKYYYFPNTREVIED